MNRSAPVRSVAALASVCITFLLFNGVSALAQPPQAQAAVQLAKAPPVAAQAGATSAR